ncbi:hypothetical protein CONPUDRAFT_57971, partial [Coniophora puteana RWD-64-598 SS2]
DHPLLEWMEERQVFLDELLRGDGRSDCTEDSTCRHCRTATPKYRCRDCFGGLMYCQACMVEKHTESPLHRVESWNGKFFERTSLKDIGLVIQLNHPPGEACLNPKKTKKNDFTVIDVSGIHNVCVWYCRCTKMITRYQQLLRASWFPATTRKPKSAATFRVLEQYHLLACESKASAYEFYNSLARRTDNSRLTSQKDRYDQFLRMMREWRHLKMLKRSGMGHQSLPLDDLPDGSCAIRCPACPQPGRNLPDGWEKAKDNRWLYSLFVGVDANFRLKRKNVSNADSDPSLGCGLSYFVREKPYKDYLATKAGARQDRSSCSSHKAVNMAASKWTGGLATTGVGTIDCARHGMKLPCGVADLQFWERYANMDYIVFSALRFLRVKDINISYDIACQWCKNLRERIAALPSDISFDQFTKFLRFFVPKFHLPAHVARCQTRFSFNYMPGVGRTDGEAPERGWANIDPVAGSTKEMGPGHRLDTLDDFFGDWNWKKLIGLGALFLRRYEEAEKESKVHTFDLKAFESAIPSSTLLLWRKEVALWERDPDANTNPFESQSKDVTMAEVRLRLAEEDASESALPVEGLENDMTPSALISTAIDLQDQQRRLRVDRSRLGAHATDTAKAAVQHRTTILRRKVENWARVQVYYMPSVGPLRAVVRSPGPNDQPEDLKLWLPSQLPSDSPCPDRLLTIEFELRVGQAYDALAGLRRTLQLRSYLYKYKDRFIRGQGLNTKAQDTIEKTQDRLKALQGTYTIAYGALTALLLRLPEKKMPADLKILEDSDVRAMVDHMSTQSEGRRRMTWIWRSGELGEEGEDFVDGLRVEWCKARARALRWTEETMLLKEEMRRTLAYLDWQAVWWDQREDSTIDEGSRAYAAKQARLQRSLRERFATTWVACM